MYVALITAEDEPDEGPLIILGPYESQEVAQQDGDGFASFCDDEYPDHEWTVWVEEVLTYESALLAQDVAKQRIEQMRRDFPEFFNHS